MESPRTEDDRTPEQAGEAVIPLLAEEITVSKQTVETGRVQVSRITHEREQLIDELLAHDMVEIDRTPINREIDTLPSVREEGDNVVIPIVEEVLVIERRLLLKEEVRVRRVRLTERHLENVTLRYHSLLGVAFGAGGLRFTQTTASDIEGTRHARVLTPMNRNTTPTPRPP